MGENEARRDSMLTTLQAGDTAWFFGPPMLSEILDLTETLGIDPRTVRVIPGGARLLGVRAEPS